MVEFLACRLGRNDEAPNIELAKKLCDSADKKGIREIADGLKSKEQAVANDCVKVLYEIGQRKPELIEEFADDFITALSSKNNRIVWGSMMALACITPSKPEVVFNRLSEIIAAYKNGSSLKHWVCSLFKTRYRKLCGILEKRARQRANPRRHAKGGH